MATVIDCYSKKVVGWAMDDHYSVLKNEWLHHHEFATRHDACRAVVHYIEGSNNRRLHSGLDYHTPNEIETEYHHMQLAA